MRQDDAHRPDDVRCRFEQYFAFGQGFADEAELVIFEIAQAAVNILAGARARALREIALFAEDHPQSASSRIACDPRAVDAAADDQKIDNTSIVVLHVIFPISTD